MTDNLDVPEVQFKVTNSRTGIVFNVRIVEPGQLYGRDNCLVNDTGRNKIEFYDTRYKFDADTNGNMMGQFVSRYYLETILKDMFNPQTNKYQNGLLMDGGTPNWSLDSRALVDLKKSLEERGYTIDNPNHSNRDVEKSKVTWIEWFRTRNDDKDFRNCSVIIDNDRVEKFVEDLRRDSSIDDIQVTDLFVRKGEEPSSGPRM